MVRKETKTMCNSSEECCGNCKWNEYSPDGNGWRNGKFYCVNEESEYCGIPISYDDACENWKAKEE